MPLHRMTLADSAETLDRALESLAEPSVVGVDVERADSKRYFKAAALIQVGGGGNVAVVDPLALDDLTPLDTYLAERRVVLHAMENDLGPLETLGVIPPLVDDTAVAAALLGLPTGLEALLSELLGVELSGDKQAMQRADWEARPLAEDMLAYAAADVADLPALWEELASRLAAAGREQWYAEEIAARRTAPTPEQRRAWHRTRGAGRLEGSALARLRSLWETREDRARSTDTAPAWIASDKILVDLAQRPPSSPRELGRRGIRRQAVQAFGTDLFAALSHPVPHDAPAARDRPTRRPTDEDRKRESQLRAIRTEQAKKLGLDAGVLCPSRTIMRALLTDPASPEDLRAQLELRDWQWEQLCGPFCEALDLDGGGER